MFKKKTVRKLIAESAILSMLLININSAAPIRAAAKTASKEATAVYLNTKSKNLYLKINGADSYDFDVVASKKLKGAAFTWYVKADKGNPRSVAIDRRTGLVTAKEAGTAYIRCKVKLKDGTILRPEAKVKVINNITGVSISNLPENMTLTAGYAKNFDYNITDTNAGKGTKTDGIIRWEITEDTAGTGSADTEGIVYPVKEGSFKLRAVAFQNKSQYSLWLKNKIEYNKYLTAASDWQKIKVVLSDGKAVVNTKEQFDKALASKDFNEITLASDTAGAFVIEQGDYSAKSLIVDTPNADISNYGVFKKITVKAVKDNTWIEYADGNIVYLTDNRLSLMIDKEADIKQIVIDQPDCTANLVINGSVGMITVLQPAQITLSGSSTGIPLTVEEKAGKSTITASAPLKLNLNADAYVILNRGSENSSLDKSVKSIAVNIENNSEKSVTITTNKTGAEIIEAEAKGISNETTAPAPVPNPTPNNIVPVTSLTVTPKNMVLSVTGSALAMLTAVVTPADTTDTVTWSSVDESVAKVDKDGIVTSVGLGTTPIVASAGSLYAVSTVTVVSGSALSVSGSAIQIELKSIGSTIAKDLADGAVAYVGGELMGWGLKESGIGFKDATQTALDEMNHKLDQISEQITNLEAKLNEAVAEIEKQILDSEYNTRVGQMSALIGQIKSIQEELNSFIAKPIKDDPKLLEESRQQIMSNIKNNLISNENLIHNQLIGVGSQESLIKVFSRAVKMDHRFLSSEDSAKVTTMYGYFEALQTSMLDLMVEYYHAIGEGGNNCNNINRVIKTYKDNIAAQKSLLLQEIPENVIIDSKQNIMIYTGYYRNIFYPHFDSRKTLPNPLYSSVYAEDYSLSYMCYNYGHVNWRFITFDELQSWVKASNGDLLSYLIKSGWKNPNMDRSKEIAIYEVPFANAGTNNVVSCYGHSVNDGKSGTGLISIDGGESYFIDPPDPFHQASDYRFYWIVCRTMDNTELGQYFY